LGSKLKAMVKCLLTRRDGQFLRSLLAGLTVNNSQSLESEVINSFRFSLNMS
jgi:hypothetical protein